MMQECDQETIRIIMPKQAGPLKGQLAVEVIPFARQPMKKAQNLFVSTQLAIPILIQFMRSRKIDPKQSRIIVVKNLLDEDLYLEELE